MHVQINGMKATVTRRSADGAWLAVLSDGRHMQLGPEVGEAALEGFALGAETWTDGPTHIEGSGRPNHRGPATINTVEEVPATPGGDPERPLEFGARTTIWLVRAGGQDIVVKVAKGFTPEVVDAPIETIEGQKARVRAMRPASPGRALWLSNLEAAVAKAEQRLEAARAALEKARGPQ